MNKKLTLLLDEGAIRKGKVFAEKNSRSVSQLVQDYFLLLGEGHTVGESVPISKKLSSLAGIGKGELDTEDYYVHIERKHA